MAISNLSAQQTETKAPLTKADYLSKSKSQKIGGFVLLGIGVVCIGIAAPGNVSFDALPILVIGGAGCIVGSIPLFLAAGRNKRKANAMSAYIEMQSEPVVQQGSVHRTLYPAISVRLGL